MRWTEEEAEQAGLKKDDNGNWHYPKPAEASKTNSKNSDSGKMSKREPIEDRDVQGLSEDGEEAQKDGSGGGFQIFITSFRHRDFDPDNLYPKWYIDQIVKGGIIPDDSSKYVDFVGKRVVVIPTDKPECTLIDVYQR